MPLPMPFEENGVRVDFPDANNFRLSDCEAYKAIKSKGVKEMDIGWFDTTSNTLWLVELKGFHNPANIKHQPKDLSNPTIVGSVMEELLDKSIHTICQVTTDRAGTKSCVGQPIADDTAIKIVHLIRVMPGQDAYLDPMQDAIRNKLRPFIAIYNIGAVAVISYDYAVSNRLLNWII
mgnify:CR=1 FL=1